MIVGDRTPGSRQQRKWLGPQFPTANPAAQCQKRARRSAETHCIQLGIGSRNKHCVSSMQNRVLPTKEQAIVWLPDVIGSGTIPAQPQLTLDSPQIKALGKAIVVREAWGCHGDRAT